MADDDRIIIWKNNKAKDNHPDLRGILVMGGDEYEVALWRGQSRNTGKTQYSGKVQPKRGADQGGNTGHGGPAPLNTEPPLIDDEEIPF